MRRNIRQIKRRKVCASHIVNSTVPGTEGRAKLDTRADTSCCGKNFWLDELTGQTCNVSPFSSSYDPMLDVQVATCLTAYTDEFARTWILVFNEVLWFGTSMDHSLINPNQIRMTGISVSDRIIHSIKHGSLASSKTRFSFPFELTERQFTSTQECLRIKKWLSAQES
jgi:hypothetical protein